jgi:putative inorganic carbon (HCO3(-)) transporter
MTTPNRPVGAGLAGGGLWPAHIPRPQAPGTPTAASAQSANAATELPPEASPNRWPWRGVKWTLTYIGFLGYIFAITTYRFPIGDVAIVCALVGLLTQKEPLRVPGLLKGLGLFILWGMIGYSVTNFPTLVYARLDMLVKLWLIALVAANALRTREQVRFFLIFWLACFALFPVRGALFNYYIYRETIFGRALWNYIFSNPNDLAAYCILQLSMTLGLHAIEDRGPFRFSARLGLGVLPMLILLTKSRGAFLGFAAFLLLVLTGQRKRGRAIALTVLMAGVLVSIAPPDVLDRVFALKKIEETGNVGDADEEGSAKQRYEIWKVARTIIAEHPIAGVGLGAYPGEHARYALRANFDPTARGRRDTHSTYLNVAAEAGVVGFLIFAASYLGTLISIERIRRRVKKLRPRTAQTLFVMEIGTLGFFIAAIFGSMAHVSFLVLHVVTMWSIADLARREVAAATPRRRFDGMQLMAPAAGPAARP